MANDACTLWNGSRPPGPRRDVDIACLQGTRVYDGARHGRLQQRRASSSIFKAVHTSASRRPKMGRISHLCLGLVSWNVTILKFQRPPKANPTSIRRVLNYLKGDKSLPTKPSTIMCKYLRALSQRMENTEPTMSLSYNLQPVSSGIE